MSAVAKPVVEPLLAAAIDLQSLQSSSLLNQRLGLAAFGAHGHQILPRQRHILPGILDMRSKRRNPPLPKLQFLEPGQPVRDLTAAGTCHYPSAAFGASTGSGGAGTFQAAQIVHCGLKGKPALFFLKVPHPEEPPQRPGDGHALDLGCHGSQAAHAVGKAHLLPGVLGYEGAHGGAGLQRTI